MCFTSKSGRIHTGTDVVLFLLSRCIVELSFGMLGFVAGFFFSFAFELHTNCFFFACYSLTVRVYFFLRLYLSISFMPSYCSNFCSIFFSLISSFRLFFFLFCFRCIDANTRPSLIEKIFLIVGMLCFFAMGMF